MMSVRSARNGSTYAVETSGISCMSDSWIDCEAADRRAVEQLADGEELLVDGRRRDVEVLLHTRQVGEADVEELDIRVLDELEHFGRITEHVTESPRGWRVGPDGRAQPSSDAIGTPFPDRDRECFGNVTRRRGSVDSSDARRTPQTFGELEPSRWPGERLGLPESRPALGRPRRAAHRRARDRLGASRCSSRCLFAPYELGRATPG